MNWLRCSRGRACGCGHRRRRRHCCGRCTAASRPGRTAAWWNYHHRIRRGRFKSFLSPIGLGYSLGARDLNSVFDNQLFPHGPWRVGSYPITLNMRDRSVSDVIDRPSYPIKRHPLPWWSYRGHNACAAQPPILETLTRQPPGHGTTYRGARLA
jgi:hypothetical protein